MTKSNKLIIELSNLGEGSIRTVKRDLKVLLEDYGVSKMINDCIRVIDEGEEVRNGGMAI